MSTRHCPRHQECSCKQNRQKSLPWLSSKPNEGDRQRANKSVKSIGLYRVLSARKEIRAGKVLGRNNN